MLRFPEGKNIIIKNEKHSLNAFKKYIGAKS